MADRITWFPSTDPNTAFYHIERAPDPSGIWTSLDDVQHDLSGSNYDPAAGVFFYVDPTTTSITWYRVSFVDAYDQTSAPSAPFKPKVADVSFYPGLTPFGFFDQDEEFRAEADKILDYTYKKLGEPVMSVHMSATQVYAAFEEACLEYSAMVNSYQAKSALSTYLGSPTGTLSGGENKFTSRNLALQLQVADAYAAEAEVNSNLPVHSASILLYPGQQVYDLPLLLSSSGQYTGRGRIRVREVFHTSPLSAYRFFGTTSGLNYLNSQFRFESFTPETLFYLLPIWEDVLRGMQFKTSNTVRRSNYSYALMNNRLNIYPTPNDTRNLFFKYTVDPNPSDPSGSIQPEAYNGVSNLSNIPFGNIQYSGLNSLGRQWVRKMAYALAKEIEGQIRSKMASIPIPNGDLTLNGPELISDARAEQEQLRNELKELLEQTTYKALMQQESEMAEYLELTWKKVPTGIYIG